MLVSGIVIGNGVDQLAGWHGGLDGVEEADELLMPVTLHAAAHHRAVQHVEGGELWIIGQLELAHPMRLQAVFAPDALH